MNTLQWAVLAVASVAGALVIAGISLLAGLAWALISAGVLLFVSIAVLLVDFSPGGKT